MRQFQIRWDGCSIGGDGVRDGKEVENIPRCEGEIYKSDGNGMFHGRGKKITGFKQGWLLLDLGYKQL